MEEETWSFALSTASRGFQSTLKSHFELCIDFEDVDGDDELKTVYPCPFCTEDFDLLELCCHIDDEHPIESGICPVCATWVGTDMVGHITAKHGNMFKISFRSKLLEMIENRYFNLLPYYYSQHKSRYHKLESYPSLSFLRKDLQDEYWQSFSASKTAHDPWLSFLYSAAASDERENVRHDSSSEMSRGIHSDEKLLERDVQPFSSNKEQTEKAQRIGFVQGLMMSAILDPDF
ncbi:hypothetical protein L6164_010265 [Bauhinia variegata]|uniref:Uncharacterized protein n=1 Tax=Bauhinia variegata TaxID=167791 RepID=A0ACB9PMQ4_BAUVA|nr:hypothetical protein L6164_010265 [Bauhinia variegata]